MVARIYRPARPATQSGEARSREWVLEFEPEADYGREPLMGWTTMSDMKRQVKMRFDSREKAEAYARRHGIPFIVLPEHEKTVKSKSYTDNFRATRKVNWTH